MKTPLEFQCTSNWAIGTNYWAIGNNELMSNNDMVISITIEENYLEE